MLRLHHKLTLQLNDAIIDEYRSQENFIFELLLDDGLNKPRLKCLLHALLNFWLHARRRSGLCRLCKETHKRGIFEQLLA
jgi:hypothetical protein